MPDRVVTYTWLIDASYLRPGLNTLELTGPATTSPRETTGAADDRQLGYGVTAVRAGASSGHR